MRNPEYKDKLSEYSAADRAIMQASMNASRLANKKGVAKKAVAKKRGMNAGYANEAERAKAMKSANAKKKVAPKPTDSRFSGLGAGKAKSSGSMAYTAGSAKNNKATYTTGSGVRYASSSTKKAAPVQKTKSLKKNPVVRFVTSRVGGKSGGYGNSK